MWNNLDADVYGFVKPDRISQYLSVATALDFNRVKLQASALGTFIHDRIKGQEAPKDKHIFTPAIFVNGYPLRNKDLSIRAFYKQSFRMPTFNDLYYADMGNSKLSPERVTQYNLGLLYDHQSSSFISSARVSADVYYNRVKDKIVAYPKGQQFRWTMLNLGSSLISVALIFTGLLTINPYKDLYLTVRGQYTFNELLT